MSLFQHNNAINYSGYREGQSPRAKVYPTKKEIYEDLLLLEGKFFYLRIYDCSLHAYRTLEVIKEYKLNFKVMLGLSLVTEENPDDLPIEYNLSEEQLEQNKLKNMEFIEEIITLANKYKPYISAISLGNEVFSIWNNTHLPIHTLILAARKIKKETNILITYCEEYITWLNELELLAKEVDFISLHTYPAWQGASIQDALKVAVDSFNEVKSKYPNKECIITETGWPTSSHGSRIKIEYANATNQNIYNKQITNWGKENDVLIYLFEAFDEPWKGGSDSAEPEKNWGLYYVNRKRKI